MINSGGMALALFATFGHAQVFTMSEATDHDFLVGIDRVKPHMISLFPSQIAWICRLPDSSSFDLSSVNMIFTTGSCMNPHYEHALFDKFPSLVFFILVMSTSCVGVKVLTR
jgi:hypothetical protein